MRGSVKIAIGVAAFLLLGVAVGACSAWRALNPGQRYDHELPELSVDLASPAMLVFSKTAGFRHEEAIPAGIAALREIADRRGWGFHATEQGAVHNPAQLARFDVVVWLNVSGDVIDEKQKRAFTSWLEQGGGWIGIHGSGGDFSYHWPWYVEHLLAAQFIGHPLKPQFQQATLLVEDREHPATRHLESTWVRTDEWYSFAESPRAKGVRVLLRLDESTYQPTFKLGLIERELAMGDDHPIVWSHCVGAGRALYSALGHQASAYAEPRHRKLLEEAVAWGMGLHPGACEHRIAGQ
ncbi:MAG: ThuA domain-containing protein [Deltaproteobacteria bacterium]|nr:ThuA domain-containing protein [Deltaproteobacteria bacterium]MBW2361911.1 ThuA domain-containing protein [Deltaproteobacteria bacterium]